MLALLALFIGGRV